MSDKQDFSFMKTGFNLVQEKVNKQETMENIASLVATFAQNALQTSSIYVTHGKRSEVTPEDIKRAMMMEVFVFTKRPEILEKVKQMREDLFKNEEESSDEENEFICEDNQEFKESECKCALCNCLNTIKTKWIAWEPQNDFEIIFKNNIDKIPE
jgi:TRAP-type mannitol/chloroaromatic compound transport system substrate-binding protein